MCFFLDIPGTKKAADPILDLISIWLSGTANRNITEKCALFL